MNLCKNIFTTRLEFPPKTIPQSRMPTSDPLDLCWSQ